jgi:osmoprotectant transport system permease protein
VRRHARLLAVVAGLLVVAAASAPTLSAQTARTSVVVASKPFAESFILAEMFAQILESEGIVVDRRPGLGATELAFQALRNGAIDVYPEYTGTGLLAILGETPSGDADEVFRRVSLEFQRQWGVHWLPPLGFENTYAIAVRRETAEELGLATLSDLARVSSELTAGFSPDFIGRRDGLPGLEAAYGLRFEGVRSLLQAVKYEALVGGRVDVIDGYSTDGAIARYDLVVLEDDRGFFPPYDAAPLVSRLLPDRNPRAVVVLSRLSGKLSEEVMRELNRRVEVDRESVAAVAQDALVQLSLVAPGTVVPSGTTPMPAPAGQLREENLARYMWARRAEILQLTLRHLILAGVSLAGAVLVALPLGLGLERHPRAAGWVIRGVGMLQTIPSIALLAFMIPLLGIGIVPALVALFLYSLLPILRNTYTGVRDADPVSVDAAGSLGMTPNQVLRLVRLPLAAPVIMAGVRTAAVINIGTATLAAFIGAGGLGDPIVSGLALSDTRMILSGAIPAALLALVVDGMLGLAERAVRPRGVGAGARVNVRE